MIIMFSCSYRNGKKSKRQRNDTRPSVFSVNFLRVTGLPSVMGDPDLKSCNFDPGFSSAFRNALTKILNWEKPKTSASPESVIGVDVL